jgi:hypothetical protein
MIVVYFFLYDYTKIISHALNFLSDKSNYIKTFFKK